jgi:hypothetical protein
MSIRIAGVKRRAAMVVPRDVGLIVIRRDLGPESLDSGPILRPRCDLAGIGKPDAERNRQEIR